MGEEKAYSRARTSMACLRQLWDLSFSAFSSGNTEIQKKDREY